jgi:hypothetical protein
MFPLNIAKVDLVLHILWTPSAAAGPASVCVGVEGVRAAGAGNRAGANRDGAGVGHEAARDIKRAWDTERRKTPREVGVRRGRPDASPIRMSEH